MSQTSIFFQEPKDLYFADESDILTVGSTDLATPIDVMLSAGDELLASFSLDTYNGLAIIPVGEILRSAGKRNSAEILSMSVEVSQEEVSASLTAKCVFCRRYTEEAAEMHAEWLTSGPAERTTYPGAAEALPFLADPDAISQNAMALVTFADGAVRTWAIATLKNLSGDGLDVSHEAIRDFARSQMLYSDIESYSVWIEYMDSEGSSRTGSPVKFVVNRDRLERHTYKFVNPKGAWEYIHASGDLKRTIETDTGTFVTSGVETEISNDATRVMEQNSGHIGGAAEAEFWLGFLASRERYFREADGTERQIVVGESNPSVTDLKVGEVTFKWHYGNKNDTIINRVSIPVEGIEIAGDAVVNNGKNRLQLGIVYTPAATTQRGVVWQITEGSEYASISATGLLTVKEGADGNSVTVKAVSSHNGDIQATKILTVTWNPEAAESYGLTVGVNVESPAIALSIDGTAVEYFDGILVAEGQTVVITVSKNGFTTQTRTITFSYENKDQWFELIQSVNASVAYPERFGAASQEVAFVISDPSNRGWTLEYDGISYYFLNGARATGNYRFCTSGYASGTGDAVVYLTFKANTGVNPREFYTGASQYSPFYFKDETSKEETSLYLIQLGTSGVLKQVTSVDIPASLSLQLGASATLSPVTVLPSDADNKTLAWSSNNESVAVVDQSGKVTAVGIGNATITARATDGSNCQDVCYITVSGQPVAVDGVSLNKSSLSLKVGGRFTLLANVSPANASDKTVTWSSSSSSIASVVNGVVTAVDEGVAIITVTTYDGGYTATCVVTVEPDGVSGPGSVSVDDISVPSIATSASAEIDCEDMDIETLAASTNSSWITGITVDKSSVPPRVRLTFNDNRQSSNARTASIQVSGDDLNGDPVQPVTFTLTQRGYSTSDVPCTVMNIAGPDTIANSDNEATYGAGYQPNGCTQSRCVWSLVSGSSYAEIEETSDNRLKITVKPGASGASVKIRATNYYNNQVYVEKTITVTYIEPSAIVVSPASVTVQHDATGDNSPVVSATGVTGLSVQSVSGFITSATVSNGRLVTVFTANDSGSSRVGSVVLQGFDQNDNPITARVGYTQGGVPASGNNIAVTALNVAQTGGNVTSMFKVNFHNGLVNQTVFGSVGYTLVGKDSGGNTVFTREGSLSDKTVASMATETEIYTVTWKGTLGMSVEYDLTVSANTTLHDTYTGDGDDII